MRQPFPSYMRASGRRIPSRLSITETVSFCFSPSARPFCHSRFLCATPSNRPAVYGLQRPRAPIQVFLTEIRASPSFVHKVSYAPRVVPLSPLEASFATSILIPVLLLAAAVLFLPLRVDAESFPTEDEGVNISDAMAVELAPGRVGNVTPEEEAKLRQLWSLIFQICGVKDEGKNDVSASSSTVDLGKTTSPKSSDKSKRKLGSLFSRKPKDSEEDVASSASSLSGLSINDGDKDDKYGHAKQYQETLASMSPESIRAALWTMIKHDHPDVLALRFLRARKWDVEKALFMMISTMNWRAMEMHVDDDIMRFGEAAAAEQERSGDANQKKLGGDFMAQIRMGKSFLHGVDRMGRLICVVNVRLHRAGEQCEESLERYTVYLIETARMLLPQPVDTACIVFDMTEFSMANMDYTPVKFMIKCFEANYPESLGAVLVHKAPWIFQGIWKVIRGWLDPVVAAKVHFTNNLKDVEEFIAVENISKGMGGVEKWEYKYEEPIPGENDTMKDVEARDQLLSEREEMVKEFESTTLRWIQTCEADASGEKVKEAKARREALAHQLHEGYWRLDPYIRARSLYDRQGLIGPNGNVDHYPERRKVNEVFALPEKMTVQVPVPLSPGITTSADDVD